MPPARRICRREAVHLSSNREPARLAMDPDSNQTGLRHSEHSA